MNLNRAAGSPAEEPPYSPRIGWTAVTVFVVLYAVAYLDRKVISLLVDPIRASLGVTDFQVSILQGVAFVFFYTIFALPIGRAVDRYSRRNVIFWGMVVWSLFAMMSGLARTYLQLLATRFGVGAGEASLHPAALSSLADLFPRDRLTGALSIFGLGGILGAALSVAIGGVVVGFATKSGGYVLPIIGLIQPWQLVFIVTGAPGIILAFVVFVLPEPKRRQAHKPRADSLRFNAALVYMLERRRFYLSHFLGFSVVSVIVAGFLAWAPTHMMRTFHLPVAKVGITMAVFQLTCGVIGTALPGQLVDRMFRRGDRAAHLKYFIFGILVLGGAGIAFGLAPTVTSAWVCVALFDLAIGFYPVAMAALQISTPNHYRGQATATFLVFYNIIGQGFGPSVVAALSDFVFHNDRLIGLAFALTCAIATPVALLFFAYGMKGMREAVADVDR